ncbi:MAG TPA: hypothetical protein PLC89_08945 [Haliscomenobacter sp.]|uniref:hypothetical protein n=1 Tax=Haliscomenobacter sp. TaxID=2717303 RepID=UPI002C297DD1|nr:hypothetical protein [Haliscomenobacter sp.]HOY17407.1 hypothetical protein [Haliscomenobacter sp.]
MPSVIITAMKDVVFNAKMTFLQQALSAGTRLLQVDQQPSMMRWLVAMRLLRHLRSLNKQIKAIALPEKIETTPQYMQVMFAMDQLEEVLDFLKTLPTDQVMPGALRRAIASVRTNTDKRYQVAELLIKPFDSTPETNYFFEVQDQREVWKRRNKNYTYLNLQPHRPEQEGLRQALATLKD